jgi:hypothetical protein
LGVVAIVVVGFVGTRQFIAHSTAAVVVFGIFVLVVAFMALPADPRVRVADSGVLGIYFTVSGFSYFGGLHSVALGCVGILLMVISSALLVVVTRQQGRIGDGPAEGGTPPEGPGRGQ